MKNSVKISISVAMIVVATVFLGGCSKDDNPPPLVSGSFDGTVTAKVEDASGVMVNLAAAVNDAKFDKQGTFYGNVVGDEVSFKNSGFTIKLPASGLSSYLTDVTDFFEYYMKSGDKGKIKVSNPDAQIMDVDFIGFYYDDDEDELYVSGLFSYTTTDKKVTCLFVYVDSDVDITGSASITVSLKKGWNRVYLSDKLTTKAPDGLKWYFQAFK